MILADKVAVVTGGGAGIGRAIALACARAGAKIVVVDVDHDAAERVRSEITMVGGIAVAETGDVSRPEDAERFARQAVSAYGRLDILVNNAGIYFQGDVTETSERDWDRLMAINVKGVFLCSKAAVLVMIAQGSGAIVNIASEAGVVGFGGQVAYNTSKAAVLAITRSMAIDHAAQGIRVNAVSPGTTFTPLVEAAILRAPDPGEARRRLEQSRPLRRLGRPEEIAAAVVFLASDECAYATGSNFAADGGYTAW